MLLLFNSTMFLQERRQAVRRRRRRRRQTVDFQAVVFVGSPEPAEDPQGPRFEGLEVRTQRAESVVRWRRVVQPVGAVHPVRALPPLGCALWKDPARRGTGQHFQDAYFLSFIYNQNRSVVLARLRGV